MKTILSGVFLVFSASFVFSQKKLEYTPSTELIQKAREYRDNEEYDKAIIELEKIHDGDSLFFTNAVWEKMYCYSQTENYTKVKEIGDEYWNFRDRLPTEFYLIYGTALDFLELYDEAQSMYVRLLEEFPTNYSLWYNYGISFSKSGQHQKAYDTFKKTVIINPLYPRVHLAIATYAIREKHTTKAVLALNMYALLSVAQGSNIGALQILEEVVTTKYWSHPSAESPVNIQMDNDEDFSDIDQLVHNYIALEKNYKIPSKLDLKIAKQSHLVFTQISKSDLPDDGFWNTYYVRFFKQLLPLNKFAPWSYLISSYIENANIAAIVKKNAPKAVEFFKWSRNDLSTAQPKLDLSFIGLGNVSVERGDNTYHIALAGDFTYDKVTSKITGDVTIYGISGRKEAEGNFNKNGKKEGAWKYYYENGSMKEYSIYKDGILTDTGYTYLTNGLKQYQLSFKNDKIDGDAYIYENGILTTKLFFTAGEQKNGDFIKYYPNGQIDFKYTVKDGLAEGEYVSYYDSGELFKKSQYKAGAIDGEQTVYFRNGKVRVIENYTADKLNGEFKKYYENGQLETTGKFTNGNRVGEWKSFYIDGKEEVIENFDETGKENGIATYFHSDGTKYYEMTYKKGDVIAYKYYTPDGKVATEGERKPGSDFLFKSIYKNGNVRAEGKYGKKGHHGVWKFWNSNGALETEKEHNEGMSIGTYKKYYPNGNIEIEYGFDKKGNSHGYYSDKFRNGNLYQEGFLNKGNWDGPFIEYTRFKTVYSSSFYIDGSLNGFKRHYASNGNISRSQFFEKGLHMYTILHDTSGVQFDTLYNHPERTIEETKICESCPIFMRTPLVNTMYHGEINYFYPNGKVLLAGENFNGKRNGVWKWYHPNGKIKSEGTYVYGDKHGEWKSYDDQGRLTDVDNYYYDELHGKSTEYDENGKVIWVSNYQYGLSHGEFEYYIGGEWDHTRIYEDGFFVSYKYKLNNKIVEKFIENETGTVEIYWNNGKLARKFTLDKGYLQGDYVKHYTGGQLHSITTYENDWKVGKFKSNHSNGKVKEEGDFEMGVKVGNHKSYFSNGKVKTSANYINGSLFGEFIEYDDKGVTKYKFTYYNGEIIGM